MDAQIEKETSLGTKNLFLLAGGMNVNGRRGPKDGSNDSEEYKVMMAILEHPVSGLQLRLQDLLFRRYGEHPVTYGALLEDEKTPAECVSKKMQGACVSVDYVFHVETPQKDVNLVPAAQLEKFPLPKTGNVGMICPSH